MSFSFILTLITIYSEGPSAGQFRHPHEAENNKDLKVLFPFI